MFEFNRLRTHKKRSATKCSAQISPGPRCCKFSSHRFTNDLLSSIRGNPSMIHPIAPSLVISISQFHCFRSLFLFHCASHGVPSLKISTPRFRRNATLQSTLPPRMWNQCGLKISLWRLSGYRKSTHSYGFLMCLIWKFV